MREHIKSISAKSGLIIRYLIYYLINSVRNYALCAEKYKYIATGQQDTSTHLYVLSVLAV